MNLRSYGDHRFSDSVSKPSGEIVFEVFCFPPGLDWHWGYWGCSRTCGRFWSPTCGRHASVRVAAANKRIWVPSTFSCSASRATATGGRSPHDRAGTPATATCAARSRYRAGGRPAAAPRIDERDVGRSRSEEPEQLLAADLRDLPQPRQLLIREHPRRHEPALQHQPIALAAKPTSNQPSPQTEPAIHPESAPDTPYPPVFGGYCRNPCSPSAIWAKSMNCCRCSASRIWTPTNRCAACCARAARWTWWLGGLTPRPTCSMASSSHATSRQDGASRSCRPGRDEDPLAASVDSPSGSLAPCARKRGEYGELEIDGRGTLCRHDHADVAKSHHLACSYR